MKSLKIKILSFLLVFSFAFSPIFSLKSQAFFGGFVFDASNFVQNTMTAANTTISSVSGVARTTKDFALDALAWMVVNLIIERMAAQTVNWINSGFQGSPAFITDTGGFFQDLGDKVAGEFIFNHPNFNFLCGPISARVRLTLAQNYVQDNRVWRCTLTNVVSNIDNFMDDFSQGGWDGFFELTMRPQNNPIGAYLQAESELMARIFTRQETLNKELNWGKGVLSYKECLRRGPDQVIQVPQPDGEPTEEIVQGECLEERINTPGSVIESKLNSTLDSGRQRLQVADEINEIVGALLTQMTSQIVGGIGKGLRSLSQPSSGGTQSTSFANQLLQGTTTDILGNTPNTDILDIPEPQYGQFVGDPNVLCDPNDPSRVLVPICNEQNNPEGGSGGDYSQNP